MPSALALSRHVNQLRPAQRRQIEDIGRQVRQPGGLVRQRMGVIDGDDRRGLGVHHQANENRSEVLADFQRLQLDLALPEQCGQFARAARQAGRR